MSRPYQVCTRCIMDTSDPAIEFDAAGVCNRCRQHELSLRRHVPAVAARPAALQELVARMKAAGRGKAYDVIIGVSGGVDSTYVAYRVRELGLRPLAVHMDNGWNSELAVGNIENVLKKLDIDLYTDVLDWQEFRDLQLSFLKASVSDAEIPTDHAIWAVLYRAALRHHVRYILLGTNYATEGILPSSWTYGVKDWIYIRGVQRRFGTRKLRTYPHFNLWDLAVFHLLHGIQTISILDYLDYDKESAMQLLARELDWRDYGGKHYESIYTRFFQGYILPMKFGIDKRRAHLSSRIVSGQVSRDAALAEMAHQPYAGYPVEEDREYVLKKLEITPQQFEGLMALPVRTHRDYPSLDPMLTVLKRLSRTRLVAGLRARFRPG